MILATQVADLVATDKETLPDRQIGKTDKLGAQAALAGNDGSTLLQRHGLDGSQLSPTPVGHTR